MTKDNQRQGMAELLAKQRDSVPLTPAEAARQRRLRQAQEIPATATATAGAGSAPDLPPAGEDHQVGPRLPGPVREKTPLLAAACAVAVSLACWLAVSQRRRKKGHLPLGRRARPARSQRWHRR
jgi:hypothetical protein